MNGTLKTVLRIAFLVILIWLLAASLGYAPGASIKGPGFKARVGKKNCNARNGNWRRRSWIWGSNGMYGDMVSSTGQQTVGINMGATAR